MKRIIVSILLVISSIDFAKAQLLPFLTYSVEQGLTQTVVNDIIQGPEGYIWIATEYGLNRFDGIDFKAFYRENGLNDNVVRSLLFDSNGRLWIGTGEGLNYMEEDSIYTYEELAPLENEVVTSLFEDSNGDLWIGTDENGVWTFGSNRSLIQNTTIHGLANNRVRAIIEDDNKTIWVGTRGGLTSLQNGSFRSYHTEDGLPEERIRDLAIDKNGVLWIATREGLVKFEDNKFEVYQEKDGLISNRVKSISFDKEDNIWLGTENGVSIYEGNQFTNYTALNGLSSNFINTTFVDLEGNIWFGTQGGGTNIFLGDYLESYTSDEGLEADIVTGFTEDRQGDFWITTFNGGVARFDGSLFNWYNTSNGLGDNRGYSALVDSSGNVIIGTRDGVSVWNGNRFRDLDQNKFPYRIIRSMVDLGNGKKWFTSEAGVIYFDGEEYTQFTKEDGLGDNIVKGSGVDREGNMWFATYGGITRYDGNEFINYSLEEGVPNNNVTDMVADVEGNVWVSTYGGIARFDGNAFEPITSSDGLPADDCYFIYQTHDGYFWIGTGDGIIRFDYEIYKEGGRDRLNAFRVLNVNSGLVGRETNNGAVFEDSSHNLWFGTTAGFSKFYPDRFKETEVAPVVHITGIKSSGTDYDIASALSFSHNRSFIEIDFVGLNFSAPDQVLYEFRIKGVDPDWQLTSERNAKYPTLPAGIHKFEVRARNAGGVWSEERASITFEITAPFWLQWWFMLLVAFIIAGILFLIYNNYRVRKLVEIERIRVRIASDLHDDVGASLTEIALQSDFLQATNVNEEFNKSLKQIGRQSRHIVNSLDDIVWSIDARNDTLGDFTDRVQDYINNVLGSKSMMINYDFDDLNMQNKLPVTLKENLYLIFKEAANNIAKYSNGDKVDILMNTSGSNYEFLIHDNGSKGKGTKKTGHGLRNMEMRAHRIGANIEFTNGDGFTIKVTGKINTNETIA